MSLSVWNDGFTSTPTYPKGLQMTLVATETVVHAVMCMAMNPQARRAAQKNLLGLRTDEEQFSNGALVTRHDAVV